jgi:HNH endonuclease
MGEEATASRDGLAALAAAMKRYVPEGDYYAFTFRANRRGRFEQECFSEFAGWSSRNPRWELRVASLVDPAKMADLWDGVGQQWVSVHTDAHLGIFLRLGGNALVAKEIAQHRLPELLEPREFVHNGEVATNGFGFLGTSHLDDVAAESGLAKGKLRMRVLERDGYRCVVCGRRPKDHLDLELHVHHVVPRRLGGPTAEENLVTLCGTCHKGLDPDFQPMLREIADLPGPIDSLDANNAEFREDVARYRELVSKALGPSEGSASRDEED